MISYSFNPEQIISSRWKLSRFGALFYETQERNGDDPVGEPLSVSEYYGVIPRISNDGQMASEDLSSYRVVRPMQLAANVMWLNRSGLAVSQLTGYISPAYKVFDISSDILPSFADKLLRSSVYRSIFESLGRGVRPNSQMIDTADLRKIPIPHPPLSEQRAIAEFLDRETAKIDALTAKQAELIELLKERRAATITAAVRYYDSGHTTHAFPMLPINRMAVITLGKMLQSVPIAPTDIEANYLRAAHIQPNGIILDLNDNQKMWFTPLQLKLLELHAGDVVVVEGGAGYGRSAVFTDDMEGWAFQNSIIRCRPKPKMSEGRYLNYALQSALSSGEIELASSTTTIPHFTAEKAARFQVPAPNLDEQRAIADLLDRVTAKIDALIAKAEESIALSQERRAALITAAVTGQIDVTSKEA